ncbi:MAG: beta-N-acetylhexosaminidase [Clostridium sp.]|nr:beta-N-acetylhexosaminidase [Clostridium sp.]MCM1444421.1 beta-N-acetylhexosaminidase [Candidatus Amulumruptor caecigallinarius]
MEKKIDKMNKKIIITIFLLMIIIALVLFIFFNNDNKLSTDDKLIPDNKLSKDELIEQKVNQIMENMTIEQKISQMLIIYYENDEVGEDILETLNKNTLGGFILMKKNFTTYDKTKEFVSTLQENSSIPLIISVDQEGGNVQRMQYLTDVNPTYIPYMYDLGKTNDEHLSYQVGKIMAEELRTIGANVTYAPVADIYLNKNNTVIGKRSFSENPDTVSKMSTNLAKGLEENGVIATYKHFPGHGDTDIDSHYNLPVINKTYNEINEVELIPFKKAIEQGAKIIMVGHIALPQITGDNTPATLSKVIITDILKDNMGYNGLVITDALNMKALTNTYSNSEIYIKSVEAGVDLLLMPNDYKEAINVIKNNITEERINESVKKILTFKYTYLEDYKMLGKEVLGSSEHNKVIEQIKVENNQ